MKTPRRGPEASEQPSEQPLSGTELPAVELWEERRLTPEAENDYIALRDNLFSLAQQGTLSAIALSSTLEGEGTSTVAVNLATAMARNREARILLVDANLRRPRLHELFAVGLGPGLSGAVRGDVTPGEAVAQQLLPNLSLMTAGYDDRVEPSEMFRSEAFREFVRAAAEEFEFVIFDSPPINQFPDASILSTVVDGTLLVIEVERVIYEVIQKAKERIERNGGRIVGAVLNRRRYYIPELIYRRI